ncbi:hypothetical protein [Pseudalkalibacillus salsuginis]|uniref:hypothetical protein n=1 Tax=Pseudalkalibacillus salsuginis TaxID=2910972 RepID=UPI001CD35EB5|nr:hypothetical protein [Pseudalkalibacillus salsuginis]MCF6408348.1 hypothetical protein [Pseudalkalibacillus salsuginis]
MRIKVVMNSGKEYVLQMEKYDFHSMVMTEDDAVRDELVEIHPSLYINPSHISSYEILE